MDSAKLQGWHADPCGLHEARYFSAGRPTKLVRDGVAESYDEPTPEESWPTAAVTKPDGTNGTLTTVPGWHPEPELHTVAPTTAPVELSEWTSDLGAMFTSSPESERADSDLGAAPPRKRPWAAFAGAAVIIGGTVAGLIVLSHQGSAAAARATTDSPAAFVAASAHQSMAQKTVEMSISGTLQSSGPAVQLQGNGTFDFATRSMSLDFAYSYSGHSVAERMVMTSRYVYLAFSIDGRSPVVGGRHWMQWPITEHEPFTMTQLDMSSTLAGLEQPGASVTALGTKSINGQSCFGYAVIPAGQAGNPQSATMVWAGSDQLLCQVSVVLQQNSSASSDSAAGQIVINFTHYGAPVHITAPAQSDSASPQQWVSTLNRETAPM